MSAAAGAPFQWRSLQGLDVRNALERPADEAEHQGLVARLERSALAFETTHPMIAGAINRLTHALSSMGI